MSGQKIPVFPLLLVLVQLALASAYKYDDRINEIDRHCSPYLSSPALELQPDKIRQHTLKDELSFSNGEWEQEPDIGSAAPFMLFDESDMFWDWFSYSNPLRSVSFEITENDGVLVKGKLSIGMHRKGRLGSSYDQGVGFSTKPGFSLLVMDLEGVYIETTESGGERLLCLLGNSRSSSRDTEPDGGVLLVLHYPRVFNLSSQAIVGEMVSLSPSGTGNYFHPVRITSLLGQSSSYKFNETADTTDLEVGENRQVLLSSRNFCRNFRGTPLMRFSIEQDDTTVGGGGSTRKIGPFLLSNLNKDNKNWQYEEFDLVVKPIECDGESGRVSIFIWIVPESMDQETAASRAGVSSGTMVAEGTWDPPSSRLSMVGCVGSKIHGLEKRCSSRVSLYFPKTLSLAQRSPITGTISSIGDRNLEPFSDLRISLIVRPLDLMNYYLYPTPCEYNYSATELALDFWEKTRPSRNPTFISFIEKAFIRYPSTEGRGLGADLYSHLSEKLRFRTRCFPIQFRKYHKTMYFLQAEILSIGPFCGRYDPQRHYYVYPSADDIPSRILNVSVQLTYTVDDNVFTGRMEKSVTYLLLEGIYDTSSGKMDLIGCGNIEVGRSYYYTQLDCSMAVRIQYSPVNTRWLKNPHVEIEVTSRRNISDPLYFLPITLRKISVYSPSHEQDTVFRVLLEGSVRVVFLILHIGFITVQSHYMKKHPEVVPYISLVMLGIQISGYLIPLIGGSDILFKPKESNSYAESRPYGDFPQYQLLLGILHSSAKILLLVMLILTTRIFREVTRSRTGLRLRRATEPGISIPGEWKVLLLTLSIHGLGFAMIFGVPEVRLRAGYGYPFPWKEKLIVWLELVENFFMLPQIVINFLWESPSINPPVSIVYLVGFILSRWLLYWFDELHDPILDPNSQYDLGFGFEPNVERASEKLDFTVIILLLVAAMRALRRCWRRFKSTKSSRAQVFLHDRAGAESDYHQEEEENLAD